MKTHNTRNPFCECYDCTFIKGLKVETTPSDPTGFIILARYANSSYTVVSSPRGMNPDEIWVFGVPVTRREKEKFEDLIPCMDRLPLASIHLHDAYYLTEIMSDKYKEAYDQYRSRISDMIAARRNKQP